MKKVYVITCTLEANKNLEFTLSDVQYVFSSEKKANTQLNIIKKEAVNGIIDYVDMSKLYETEEECRANNAVQVVTF